MPVWAHEDTRCGTTRRRRAAFARSFAAAIPVLALAGCGYDAIQEAQRATRAGDPRTARAILEPMAEDGFGGPHKVLGWLEFGTALSESGARAAGNRAFLEAEAAFDEQDRRPRTSLSEELVAAATNPLNADYRGSANERVMAPTFRGINSLLLGDTGAARTAFNEAVIRQDQALAIRAARVAEAKAAGAGAGGPVNVSRSVDAALASPAVAGRLADLDRFRPYRDFVNPFSELVHAVFRLAAAEAPSDLDRALSLLRSVAGLAPNNPHVAETLEEARAAVEDGRPIPPTVHVFFATGFAPARVPVRIDLPLVFFNDQVDYVGLAFPQLQFDPVALDHVVVSTAGETVRTVEVADMDRLVAVEFREELPTLVTRAVLGSAAKVAASWGVNRATTDDDTVNAIARIAAGLYLLSQNQADTRAWLTLPKSFGYARVPAPESGVVRIGPPNGPMGEVAVEPGAVSLVFIRSMRPGVPLRVETVVFRQEVAKR